MEPEKTEQKSRLKKYLKGLGWGAFLFFLIKGLLWLAVLFGAGKMFSCMHEQNFTPADFLF